MPSNQDLTNKVTRTRQYGMKYALRRSGLGDYILRELPNLRLHPAFCQWKARGGRLLIHAEAHRVLDGISSSERLLFVTWVPHEARDAVCPMPLGPQYLLRKFAAAATFVGTTAIVAATEVDFDVKLGVWQQTIHAILRLPYDELEAVPRELHKCLGGSTARLGRVYRPLLVKPVTNLDDLIPYVFKGLAVLSTTQRATWRTPEGKARSTKQALRTPQLRQLLRQTLRDGIFSRVLIASLNEVAK